MEINKIETFAILDLETSNLPNLNFGKVKITEISIITISKEDVSNGCLARVQNKLTMLFNPQIRIDPTSSELSGLDNFMLENENIFDDNAADTINRFLNHLKSPCLVAHNGFKFDFPILKRSLNKTNISFRKDLLCIDTYPTFKILDNFPQEIKINEKQIELHKTSELTVLDNDKLQVDSKEINNTIEQFKIMNETTPKRPPSSSFIIKTKHSVNESCGEQNVRSNFKSRRSLFSTPGTEKTTQLESTAATERKTYMGYYKLNNIYKRLFNEEPEIVHQAEADVLTLHRIIVEHYRNSFVKYSEINALSWDDIKPMGLKS